MKIFSFIILASSLFFVNATAQEQKPFEFTAINDKNIPVLGEKTQRDAALAKNLNAIIKRTNNQDGIIRFYNDALIKCKESKNEDEFYGCMKENKINKWHLEYILGSLFQNQQKEIIDPFPTAKNSPVCKNILDNKIFLQSSKENYISYKNSSETKTLIFTKYQGTAHFKYFFYEQVPVDTNETEFLREMEPFYLDESERKVYVYHRPWSGWSKLFSLNNAIYLNFTTRDDETHYIFSLDKESYFFDQACKIKRTTTGYANRDKICQKAAKGEYEKILSVDLRLVLNEKEFQKLEADFNETNRFMGWYLSCIENNGYFVDYANEGKKHIVLNLTYGSAAGAGCGYGYLALYDPHKGDELRRSHIGGGEFYSLHDCYIEAREEPISIGEKNYILVSGNTGLISLNEIAKSDNGSEHINTVCTFEPIYKYE
ncbi:MAG: hypothetical protein LBS26_00855 [Campylobacteraceae bacterium]|jgi:hypothetical protein|nr:hypothetical protein [Campylobacteraceae bacterium]